MFAISNSVRYVGQNYPPDLTVSSASRSIKRSKIPVVTSSPVARVFQPAWLLALVPLILWPVVSVRDHFFRDELYYIIAGRQKAIPDASDDLIAWQRMFGSGSSGSR